MERDRAVSFLGGSLTRRDVLALAAGSLVAAAPGAVIAAGPPPGERSQPRAPSPRSGDQPSGGLAARHVAQGLPAKGNRFDPRDA